MSSEFSKISDAIALLNSCINPVLPNMINKPQNVSWKELHNTVRDAYAAVAKLVIENLEMKMEIADGDK